MLFTLDGNVNAGRPSMLMALETVEIRDVLNRDLESDKPLSRNNGRKEDK